ncbi:MAG: hypothetical protein ACLFRR_03945 [Spirochaetaceae bacterium]
MIELMRSSMFQAVMVGLLFGTLLGCAHAPQETSSLRQAPRPDTEQEGESSAEQTPAAEQDREPDAPNPSEKPHGSEGSEEGSEEERSASELISAAVELSPERTTPIASGGSWMAVAADLDANGRTDVALLVVAADPWDSPPSLDELSQPGRIARREVPEAEFYFEVYLNRPTGLDLFETRRIGRYPVVERMELVDLHKEETLPRAVSARFRDQTGYKDVWLVAGPNGLSGVVLENTSSVDSLIADVDGDGMRDLLKAQTVFEQGRGYETFLTWYRWDGTRFVSHTTTNIVRNLNNYLGILEEHLERERYRRFLNRALPAGEAEWSGSEEPVLREELSRLFVPENDDHGQEDDPAPIVVDTLFEETEIARASFPRFFENPFPRPGFETSVTVPMRIDTAAGETFYYQTTVVMDANPFQHEQFRLARPSSAEPAEPAEQAEQTGQAQ